MKQRIQQLASDAWQDLVEIRRHLHANPELSFEEHETSRFVFDQLKQLGLKPEFRADTGVVAMINPEKTGKVIALRGDMDALPITEENEVSYQSKNKGVMHACGHDVHTTSLLGVARILSEVKDDLEGSVKLIFQPGEERIPGGASLMIKDGVLKNPRPRNIIGQHVYPDLEVGKVGFKPGRYMASADEIYITAIGKGGHAALPHKNIDTVLMASHLVVALQQIVSRNAQPDVASVLSIGKIIGAGATNIIPEKVTMEGTFRTFDEHWRLRVHERIHEVCEGVAKTFGGRVEVEVRKGYPFVFNNEEFTLRNMASAKEFLGAENVIDLDLRMTAEDFAFFAKEVPGCFYRLGTRNESKNIIHPLHTSRFDVDERSLEIGAGLMSWLAINELQS